MKKPTLLALVFICSFVYSQNKTDVSLFMKKNPDFPRFKSIILPAKRADSLTPKKYPGKYLFLERYDEKWYREQYATLGRYGAAALLDCDPQMRTGSILSTDGIVYHDRYDLEIPSDVICKRNNVLCFFGESLCNHSECVISFFHGSNMFGNNYYQHR